MGKEIELGLKNRAFHIWDERKVKEEREDLPSLRSTEIGCFGFVGPRFKVHLRDDGYAWIRETRDFAEDPSEGFGEIEGVRYRSCAGGHRSLEVWIKKNAGLWL